ncbi:MAG TPA: hypothetical protein VNA65_07405, partial [Candidatus Dormibacteraeota bacterium]|nr:hypothetical protein [Candidatus Dormibacteraeota bacterium]
ILGLIAPALAIAIGIVFLYAWLRRRWGRGGPRPQPGESELLRLYERLQRRLSRCGAPPVTPLEYQHAMNALLLDEVTAAVNEGAYAGRWPAPERVRELAQRIS